MGDISKYTRLAKTWRYKLIDKYGQLELDNNPIGWDAKQLTLTRSGEYLTLFRGFSASLEYINSGFDRLKELYDSDGILSGSILEVDKKNIISGKYVNILSARLDFSEYSEITKTKNAVTIPLVTSEFQELIKNREDIEIPYDRAKDLDGNTISAGEYKTISLKGREFGQWDIYGQVWQEQVDESDIRNLYEFDYFGAYVMPVYFENVELLENFQVVSKRVYLEETIHPLYYTTVNDCFYYDPVGYTKLKVTFNLVASDNSGFYLHKATFRSGTLDITTIRHIIIFDSSIFLGETIEASITETIELEPEEGLWITNQGGNAISVISEGTNLKIDYFTQYVPTLCKVVLPHEAFDYIITAITGETGRFRSTYFGRTELGYDEDGEGAYLATTNGKLIRRFEKGYIIDDEDDDNKVAQLTYSLKELFEAFRKLKNVGLGLVYENGKWIVELEKFDYFFQTNTAHVFSDMELRSFERTQDLTYFFSEINVGYETADDDLVGGLEEYNTQQSYSTPLSKIINNVYDLVNPYSAISTRIERQRRAGISSNELSNDSTNFFIECIKVDGEIIQRTDEGFEVINGLEGLETYLNLGLTPKQTLLEHGMLINVGLAKFPESLLTYNSSAKVTDLSFRKDGESKLTYENGNEVAGELDSPIFSGFLVSFVAPVSIEDFINIQNNTTDLIRYTNPIIDASNFGWVNEISTEPLEKITNVTLIEANPPDVNTVDILSTEDEEFLSTNDDYLIET